MKNKKKLLVVLACLALCVCTVVTGTLAWLTDKSETVTNTFTTSDINITLTETLGTVNGTNREFKMVPGATIPKDPKVTVEVGSEECWLFVKVVEGNSFDTFMTYTMAAGWTALPGVDGVYYYSAAINQGEAISVLLNNQVTVKGTVTKANMNAIDGIDENGATDTDAANAEIAARPTLTFTAYAIQQQGFADVGAAWAEVSTLG